MKNVFLIIFVSFCLVGCSSKKDDEHVQSETANSTSKLDCSKLSNEEDRMRCKWYLGDRDENGKRAKPVLEKRGK